MDKINLRKHYLWNSRTPHFHYNLKHKVPSGLIWSQMCANFYKLIKYDQNHRKSTTLSEKDLCAVMTLQSDFSRSNTPFYGQSPLFFYVGNLFTESQLFITNS